MFLLVSILLQIDTKLFFRGQLIWEAMMDELLSIGLTNAQEVQLMEKFTL